MSVMDVATLRARLDRLSQQGRRHISRWQQARDVRRGLRRACVWAPVGPALVGAFLMFRLFTGAGGLSWPWPVWLLVLVSGPLVAFAVWLIRAARTRSLTRRQCLGAFDLQLGTNERLVTADEFLASAGQTTSAFQLAAIEDAAAYVDAAEHTVLAARPLPAWSLSRRAGMALVAALLLIAANLWIATKLMPASATSPDAEVAMASPAASPVSVLQQWLGRTLPMPRPQRPPSTNPEAASVTETQPDSSPRTNQVAQDAAGGSQSGGQARSRSTSQAMSSAGSPSNQQNPSQPLEDDPPQDQPTSSQVPPKPPDGRKGEPQSSSATSGQGQSRSSSVDRSAIPAVDQPDRAGANKDDGKDEEGAQDEVEEEKTSGAERPSLRRNKPPVDRNLSPRPAGDEPNPNANGRSGPGGRKKTRGVPAMILGVPTPDRIQGMTHPGRSKVTQENATPREEPQAAVNAETRAARQAPVGHIEHPRLLPWMQSLIEKYFTREKPSTAAGSGGRE